VRNIGETHAGETCLLAAPQIDGGDALVAGSEAERTRFGGTELARTELVANEAQAHTQSLDLRRLALRAQPLLA
tara:strand:+ start:1879 stop:2100 length:222 start_codon:yes stop_codon:yes gene_type:complete